MGKKIVLGFIVLLVVSCSVSIVFAMGEKPPEKPHQEYKTHVSKYGFSISYPKDWYLEEIWRTTSIPESKKGWLAFTIANRDPSFYIPRGGDNIEIFFSNFVDDLKNSPSNISDKLKYFSEKHGMRSIDSLEIIKLKGNEYCLAYGMPRGYSDKYYVLFFYLPKSKKIASAIFYSTGEYTVKKLLEKVPIEING